MQQYNGGAVELQKENTSIFTQTKWSLYLKETERRQSSQCFETTKALKGLGFETCITMINIMKDYPVDCKAKQMITVTEKATDPTDVTVSKAI